MCPLDQNFWDLLAHLSLLVQLNFGMEYLDLRSGVFFGDSIQLNDYQEFRAGLET